MTVHGNWRPKPGAEGVVDIPSASTPRPASGPTYRPVAAWPAVYRGLLGVAGFGVLIIPWQLAASYGAMSEFLLPSPLTTLEAFAGIVGDQEFAAHGLASLQLLGLGLGLSIVLGVLIGGLAGWYRPFARAVFPYLALLDATPSIALLPIFIVWLGLGMSSKLAIVIMGAVFPMCWAAMAAVRMMDTDLVRVAKSFGASEQHIVKTLLLPGSVPHLLVGIRIAFGKAVVSVLVVELFGGSGVGVGFLLQQYGQRYQTAQVFGVIVLIAVFAVVTRLAFGLLESRFDSWRVTT